MRFKFSMALFVALLLPAARAGEEPGSPLADLVEKTVEYRRLLGNLLVLQENAASAASRALRQRKQLFRDGLLSARDLEAAELASREARDKIEETRGQISESDRLVAEVNLARELEEKRLAEVKQRVVFYTGKTNLSEIRMIKLESFYALRFGMPLPLSAVGQTPVHTRLGFSHRDAVDVALHPDSSEGKELMEYLRQAGISFIAFREALEGSATGAHIHVGKPSVRMPAFPSTDAGSFQ